MLSRRNIRIKVMQLLYALGRDEKLTVNDLVRRYETGVQKTMELYLYNLCQFVEVAEYSVQDYQNRKAKLLPNEDDRQFSPKLYSNEVLQPFVTSDQWKKSIKKYLLPGRIDKDNTRMLYTEFSKTDGYKEYIAKTDNTKDEHLQQLLDLYKFCNTNESFNELMEDFHPSWIDDKSLIVGASKKTIKALPDLSEFITEYEEEDQLTREFGEQLLLKVCSNENELFELIEPMLKNWDAERVAILDMILLKLALCELMYFPTIPTKVTLNEFVEISKLYSTDKSKDFINGILDRLMKKLQKDGKIVKEGRGLIDE